MAYALGLVLYELEAECPLGAWVHTDAVQEGLKDDLDAVEVQVINNTCISNRSSDITDRSSQSALTAVTSHVEAALQRLPSTAPTELQTPLLCLVVVLFWDGQSESSKLSLAELKQLHDAKIRAARVQHWGDRVEIVVQALNAKKGTATMMQNRTALVVSLRKKLTSSGMAARGLLREGREHRVTAGSATMATTMSGAASTSLTAENTEQNNNNSTSSPNSASGAGRTGVSHGVTVLGETDLSTAAIQRAVEAGQGECFFLLSSPDRAGLAEKVSTLRANCTTAAIGCASVMMEPREVQLSHGAGSPTMSSPTTATTSATSYNHSTTSSSAAGTASTSAAASATVVVAQEFLLRRCCPPASHLELRLAMCGNVDSGKSTLTSVLTRGCRDDGRGFARAFVFNHKHEAITGRTSSVSENHLGFSATGGVVNYALMQPHRSDADLQPLALSEVAAKLSSANSAANASAGGSNTPAMRQYTPQELASRSAKVVTLYDLAGHERYLKTTVLGMTRNMPDYACIVISANNGIQRMTKEHLALCLALKLPFFVVVTRIDATPANVHAETMANVHKLLKIPTVRKLPYPVRKHDEVILAAKNLRHDRVAPIFEVSNVTGVGIAEVLQFVNLLPVRKDWQLARTLSKEMVIDSTFFVTGVGAVVGGIITQGVFRVNDTVLLGPDGFGHFRPVSIKSIHIKGVDSTSVEAGTDAALCLKKEKRSAIRKGNILADMTMTPTAYWQFEAEITILYHSTTIAANYEPVIHSTTVRQSARITHVAQEVLRTGDKSLARFHFLYRPEYMRLGQRLIFREGRTKGIGIVTSLTVDPDEKVLAKNKLRKKMLDKDRLPPPSY